MFRTVYAKKCLWCKKDFSSTRKIQKFCSYTCSAIEKKSRGISGRKKKINLTQCPNCKIEIHVSPSILLLNKYGMRFCSVRCKAIAMKTGLATWGFKFENAEKTNNVRKRIQVDKKRVYEHRWLMENKIGRKLESHEHVHHINGNPKDNRIENLQIVTSKQHGAIHKKR